MTIGPAGWAADPQVMVQSGDSFELTVRNALERSVRFVVLQMNYGEVSDLPLIDGVVDVSRQVVYESEDPAVASPPVVAYYVVQPPVEQEEAVGWNPEELGPGEERTLRIGSPGKGGGGPGAYVVASHEPGGLERGEYAIFDLTDENGEVPRFELDDFFGDG